MASGSVSGFTGPPPGLAGGPPPGFSGPPPPGFENGPPPGFTGGPPPGFTGPPPSGVTGPPSSMSTANPLQGFPNMRLPPPGALGGPLTDWQKAHYHDSRAPTLVAVTVSFGVVATLAVIARLASKRITKAKLLAEDYTMLAALVLAYGLTIIEIIGLQHGLGRHMFAVKPSAFGGFLKGQYAFAILYTVCVSVTKISILLFSRRLFGSSRIRHAIDTTGAMVIMVGITLLFGTIFQCSPISAAFSQSREVTCTNRTVFFRTMSIINVIIDFTILLLPLPVIWRLHISWGRKVGLTGVFALGTIACVASIVRIVVLERMTVTGGIPNMTWAFADSMIWSTIEPYTGIVCACLPLTTPLFRAAISGKFMTTLRSRVSQSATTRSSRPTGRMDTVGSSRKNFQPLAHESEKTSTEVKSGPIEVRVECDVEDTSDTQATPEGNVKGEDDIPMGAIQVKSDIEWSSAEKR